MKIKDRIIEFRRVPANELIPSPKNWRTHSTGQQDALKGILAEVGIAGAVLARQTDQGLMLIDGHLRTETMPDQEIPVLVLDLSESEADLLLATYDPIAAMATANQDALASLLDSLETGSEALNEMMVELKEANGLILNDGKEFDTDCADDVKLTTCPHCGKEYPL